MPDKELEQWEKDYLAAPSLAEARAHVPGAQTVGLFPLETVEPQEAAAKERFIATEPGASVSPEMGKVIGASPTTNEILVEAPSGEQAWRSTDRGTLAQSQIAIEAKIAAEGEGPAPVVIGASPSTRELLFKGLGGEQAWMPVGKEDAAHQQTLIELQEVGLARDGRITDLADAAAVVGEQRLVDLGVPREELAAAVATKSEYVSQSVALGQLRDFASDGKVDLVGALRGGVTPGTLLSAGFTVEQVRGAQDYVIKYPATKEMKTPVSSDYYVSQYFREKGWELPTYMGGKLHRGIASDKELRQLDERLREASSSYQQKFGTGEVLKSGGVKALSQVFPAARALYPDVALKDIKFSEWAWTGVSAALVAAPFIKLPSFGTVTKPGPFGLGGPRSSVVASTYTGKAVRVPGTIEGMPVRPGTVLFEAAPGQFRPFTHPFTGKATFVVGEDLPGMVSGRPLSPIKGDLRPSWEAARQAAAQTRKYQQQASYVAKAVEGVKREGLRPVGVSDVEISGGTIWQTRPIDVPLRLGVRKPLEGSSHVGFRTAGSSIEAVVPVDVAAAASRVQGLGLVAGEVRAPWGASTVRGFYSPSDLTAVTHLAGFKIPKGKYWFGKGEAISKPPGIVQEVITPGQVRGSTPLQPTSSVAVLTSRAPLAGAALLGSASLRVGTSRPVSVGGVVSSPTVVPTRVPATVSSPVRVPLSVAVTNSLSRMPTTATRVMTTSVSTSTPRPLTAQAPVPNRAPAPVPVPSPVPAPVPRPTPVPVPRPVPIPQPVPIPPAIPPSIPPSKVLPFRWPLLGGVGGLSGGGFYGGRSLPKGDIGSWKVTGYPVFGPNPLTGKVVGGRVGKKSIRYGSTPPRPKQVVRV